MVGQVLRLADNRFLLLAPTSKSLHAPLARGIYGREQPKWWRATRVINRQGRLSYYLSGNC
jgi:hypothetical protein